MIGIAAVFASALAMTGSQTADPAPPMVVVDERDVMSEEAPPHGAIGMSTAYHISSVAPGREMEFRKRVLHKGAAVGEHPIGHDEVYYVLSGAGEVVSDGVTALLKPGMAAYLYAGANVGIRQLGDEPLAIIISYPVERKKDQADD
jgi:mannose-6-phosphate isomerase-like protein (cupin superfamily)